ncbi:MAG: S4 domain-containing protein [Erythrobacter sp.]
MRIDRLLVYLRFARTRSKACAMIDAGHMRLNSGRITRHSEAVGPGDILTFPVGSDVRIVEICSLPERRGPPGKARSHYHELDRDGESALAARKTRESRGN